MNPRAQVTSLSIHLLELDHASALEGLVNDPALARALGLAPPLSDSEVRRYVERQLAARTEGLAHDAVIKVQEEVVGFCGLRGLYNASAPNLIFGVGPEYRGKGYATFGVNMLLQLAFKNLRLTRVQSCVDSSNAAAIRVLVKCGFAAKAAAISNEAQVEPGNQTLFEITREQWLQLLNGPILARLHPDLRAILQIEIAAGNAVAETGSGWPEAASVFVKLRDRFRVPHNAPPAGVIYTEPKSPHWWWADYSAGAPPHILACGDS